VLTDEPPEILPDHVDLLARAVEEPDLVLRSATWDRALLVVRRYHRHRGSMYTVVVVSTGAERVPRSWIVTAYVSRDLPKGVVEWRRS